MTPYMPLHQPKPWFFRLQAGTTEFNEAHPAATSSLQTSQPSACRCSLSRPGKFGSTRDIQKCTDQASLNIRFPCPRMFALPCADVASLGPPATRGTEPRGPQLCLAYSHVFFLAPSLSLPPFPTTLPGPQAILTTCPEVLTPVSTLGSQGEGKAYICYTLNHQQMNEHGREKTHVDTRMYLCMHSPTAITT